MLAALVAGLGKVLADLYWPGYELIADLAAIVLLLVAAVVMQVAAKSLAEHFLARDEWISGALDAAKRLIPAQQRGPGES